jgi:dolichyl-phosphate-mannose-protein mannosyltransferase
VGLCGLLRFADNFQNLIISSIGVACAFSVKWTAGGLFALCGVIHLIHFYRHFDWWSIPRRVLFLVLIPIAFQLILFVLHWMRLLYHSGFSVNYIPERSKGKFSYGNETFNFMDRVVNRSLLADSTWLIVTMHKDSMGVAPNHVFHAQWWRWPILKMIWCEFFRKFRRTVWAFGQPFVWTTGFVAVLVATVALLHWFWIGAFNGKRVTVLLMLVGYWASYLPFALVPRTTFYYHYIIPALFASLATAALLDQIENRFVVGFLGTIMTLMAVFGLVFWGPFVYGITVNDIESRVWMKDWGKIY